MGKRQNLNFALSMVHCRDYQEVIQKFDSVRYMDKTTDGFIDTFRMIFNAYDDVNPIEKLKNYRVFNDRVFKERVKRQILFWGKQWASQDRFAMPEEDKIHQLLQLARLDAWIDFIAGIDLSYGEHKFFDVELIDITDKAKNDAHSKDTSQPQEWKQKDNLDFIDVEFTDATDKAKNDILSEDTSQPAQTEKRKIAQEESAPQEAPQEKNITINDWRIAAKSVCAEIEDTRRRLNTRFTKRKKNTNIPLKKNVLLPNQMTIPFPKPYPKIH